LKEPSVSDTVEHATDRTCGRANPLRVLSVIPGGNGSASMIFAKRQAQSLVMEEIENRNFFLASRTAPWWLWLEILRFRRKIQEFQPHVVHAHFGTMTALFCAVATRLPLVITFRGSDLNPCPSMSWMRSFVGRLFSHLAAIRARHIICVSLQLRRRLWWRRNQISVIPTGVDTDVFQPLPRNAARRELGWSVDDSIVLFNAGQTPAVKRLDLAEAAVAAARRKAPAVRLVVLNGSTDPRLLPLMMNAADCLLLTSDWEGSPTVVQEALACNLPIVTVDVGDVRQRLHGVEASAIVPRNTVALAQAIVAMVTPSQRSNGRAFTGEISLRAIAPRVVDIYRTVLQWPTLPARTGQRTASAVGYISRAA
jgi:glycosyltransferase involved in cell wall biosynthesis